MPRELHTLGTHLRAMLLAATKAEFIAERASLVHKYYVRKKKHHPSGAAAQHTRVEQTGDAIRLRPAA